MFSEPTVFILGAGASWHYGYPTGEKLVLRVAAKAGQFAKFCEEVSTKHEPGYRPQLVTKQPTSTPGDAGLREQWLAVGKQFRELSIRLRRVNPPVIDYFLGLNADLQEVGKLAIAWVLSDCEAEFDQKGYNPNRATAPGKLEPHQDDWYRFITYQLVGGCDAQTLLKKNDVRFVTFNYDLSLENILSSALTHIHEFRSVDIDAFFKRCPVLHVYGSLREHSVSHHFDYNTSTNLQPISNDLVQRIHHLQAVTKLVDHLHKLSQNIRTIGPIEKTSSKVVAEATAAIRRATMVYVLGYGFDESNSNLLKLDEALRPEGSNRKNLFFTNLDDTNRVNRRVSRLITGSIGQFQPGSFVHTRGNLRCEKSVRDVYCALNVDFDLSERLEHS